MESFTSHRFHFVVSGSFAFFPATSLTLRVSYPWCLICKCRIEDTEESAKRRIGLVHAGDQVAMVVYTKGIEQGLVSGTTYEH